MAGTCAHVEFLRAAGLGAGASRREPPRGRPRHPPRALGLCRVPPPRQAPPPPLRRLGRRHRRHRRYRPRHGVPPRLAAAGLGLVLVGRNLEKLAAVAAEIKAKHPDVPEVRTFVLDFAAERLAAGVEAEALKEAIRGLDVGVLVNNTGLSYPYARYFHEVDEELMRSLTRVNVEGVTRVTHAVLPGMVERKHGAMVNIGSGSASVIPSDPMYSVYAATKAYVDQFSRCLYVEYKSKGIDVQCQVPLYVATKMASIRKSSFMVPSADINIGYEPMCTPYWPHSIMWFFISILPESFINNLRLGMCIKIRKKGLAKDTKKKSF
ncbi:hypothetical protein PVAP13_4NG075800 [Panicum virgatum]|uniref:Uncharacterized protein n=1 Tax=Panicum virgatum TaxID=38727 RepID=A0A8T0T5S7_PANVG|nr:hypothetical protein PVAP13_4NG075800 [Panicum virgatum]